MTSCNVGVSPIGRSSFGTALDAGRNRVPMPAAGITALRTCMGADHTERLRPLPSAPLRPGTGGHPAGSVEAMPTYVYRFVDTGETIEVQQAFTDDALTEATHPGSGEVMAVKKVFTPVGVTFKGGGFYKTDSRGLVVADRVDASSSTRRLDVEQR